MLFRLLFLFFICSGVAYAQAPKNWEKISNSITNAKARTDSLNKWAKEEADADFNLAEKINQHAFSLLKNAAYPSGEALAWKVKGIIYDQKSDYTGAIDCYLKSIHLYKSMKDEMGVAKCEGNIGMIFIHTEKYRESLSYFRAANAVFEKNSFIPGIAVATENLGLAYLYLNMTDSSLFYLKESEKLFDGNKRRLSTVWMNMGLVYSKKNKTPTAISYLEKSLSCYEGSEGEDPGIYTVYLNLSNEYRKAGMYQKAIEAGNIAREGYKKNRMISTREYGYLSDVLGDAYYASGEYKKAADAYIELERVRKEVYNNNNLQQVNELKALYEDEKKQLEIKNLNTEKLLQEKNLENEKTRKNVFLGALIITLLLLGGLVFLVLQKIKDKRLIEAQKKELELRNMAVEEKQKEVMDSIYYARRIQRALMANDVYIEKVLKKLKRPS